MENLNFVETASQKSKTSVHYIQEEEFQKENIQEEDIQKDNILEEGTFDDSGKSYCLFLILALDNCHAFKYQVVLFI